MKARIEFEFDECLEDEFAKNYLDTVSNMFHLFHFVESVTKCELVEDQEREFIVDYTNKHSKLVKAKNADEAHRKVINYKEGESLYFHTDVVGVKERD